MTRQKARTRELRARVMTAVGVTLVAVACSGDPAGPGPEPEPEPGPEQAEVDAYVASLGSWIEFAPPVPTSDEAHSEETTVAEQVVMEPNDEGIMHNVTYVCTVTPHSLATTPEEIVMYEPNASLMWVGNLIQGKSYKEGQGSFEELSIRQRAPLKLSIDLLTANNSAVVEDPSLTSVQSAIGDLIERAHLSGHRAGSSIVYEEEVAHSVEQATLALGISARFLGAKAKADLNIERAANERTVIAHFVQKMFTIAIELPQTPEAVFSDDFTGALLQQQVDAGNIGRNNLPVYIASVTYGRTLTYTLTSTHEESRIRAAIAASYDGVAGGGGGYSEAELRETLSQQNIQVTAIGGEGQNALDLISSGDLRSYFATDAALTSARPLSYQLNSLGDNSIAKVGETTEYSLTTCEGKVVSPGLFDFRDVQQGASPVPTPYQVYSADVNGDGRGDLVWNHVVSGSNRFAVGLGQEDGSFDVGPAQMHPATPAGQWSARYDLLIDDFTGDGADDLLWNRRDGNTANRIYLAVSKGDGTFDFHAEVTHPNAPRWGDGWRTLSGDIDNDGDADLVWNHLATANAIFTATSNGDGTFAFGPRQAHPANGWGTYEAFIGDANGDFQADIIWNVSNSAGNRTYVARSNGDGTFAFLPYQHRATNWNNYEMHVAYVNRDSNVDLIWVNALIDLPSIHRGMGQSSGVFSFPSGQRVERLEGDGALATYLGDFNDDGSADILWNDLSANRNHVRIGLGSEAGTFAFTPADQEHSATETSTVDWTAFQDGVLILDVNGDRLDDVVWVARAGTYRIYVALAREVTE